MGSKVKTIAEVRRIVDLYELYDSYKKVARELSISPNTAKKYLRRVKDLQEGEVDEILPKNRKIIQPSRVLTEIVRQKIHQYLESNLEHPRKQRLTAKRIWELLVWDGHRETIRFASFSKSDPREELESASSRGAGKAGGQLRRFIQDAQWRADDREVC